MLGGTTALTITIGEAGDGTDALSALTFIVAGNITGAAGDQLNFTTEGVAGNVLTFQGTALDLDDGVISLGSATDEVNFDGASGTIIFGNIRGGAAGEGVIDINATTTFSDAGGGTIGATASVGSILIADNATATFRAAVTTDATGDDIVLESSDATAVFDVQTGTAGSFTVTGTVEGDTADGQGIVTVIDSDTSSAGVVTFANNIGATNSLAAINIGQTTAAGGSAIFSGTVGAADINIGLADMADMNATAVFADDVTATTIDVVGEATTGTTTVTFRDNVTGLLTITDAGTDAVVIFDTETGTAANLTMNSNILGGGASEGTVRVLDSNTANTGTVTFEGDIGGTAAGTALEHVQVGDLAGDTGGGIAIFNGTVRAANVTIGDATMGNMFASATFNDDVTASTALTITGEATAGANSTGTFKGDVSTGGITLTDGGNEATMTIDGTSAQTVTGAIIGGGAGQGNLIVGSTGSNSDVTFTGAIGGTALDLFQIVSGSTANIVVAGAATVNTTSAGVGVAGIDIDGTLNLNAADGTVGVSDSVGDIDIDGTVSITGDNAVTFTAASDLFLDGTFTTALTAAATTTLASTGDNIMIGNTSDTVINAGNQIVTTGDVFLGGNTGKSVTLYVNKTAAFNPVGTAVILATGDTVELDSDSVLNVGLFADSVEYDTGDQITVIDSNEAVELDNGDTDYATLVTNGNVVLLKNGLINLSVVTAAVTEAEDLVLEIGFNDANDVFGSTPGANAANSLLGMTNAQTTGNLETIRGNLISAGSDADAQEIAEALAPSVDAGVLAASTTFTNQVSNLTTTRLASLKNGGTETGMVAGNVSQGLGIWGQVFGATGNQDVRDGVVGYDVDTYGVAVGVDTETLAEGWVWGLGFSYANSNVDSKNANTTETDVDNYQIALYGQYDWDDRSYVNGQVGYAFGNVDSTRHNVGGLSGVNANADYDADQIAARLEAGRDFSGGGNMTVTPKVLANYLHYDADDYTETGAGTANLNVDSEAVNLFELGVGVDVSWLSQNADGSYFKPGVHAGVRHDLIGDEIQSTSTFTGGGAAFETQGVDPAQTTFNVGAQMTYFTVDNWELSAAYDYEAKADYDAHAGLLKAGYRF
ncbi:MAG: autotransporter domain-containing protein [Alphaproteobacteria bacterium]|nr:autotransporter domain-containing protein [Alphaproteobacteria bacterium]